MGGGEPSPDLEKMSSAASSSSSAAAAPWDRLIEVGCIIYYRHRAYSGLHARRESRVIQVNLNDKKRPITLESGYDLATYDKIHITTDAYGNRYADPIAMIRYLGSFSGMAIVYQVPVHFERIGVIAHRSDQHARGGDGHDQRHERRMPWPSTGANPMNRPHIRRRRTRHFG